MTTDIRIRAARREDAEAIGRGVVMALHDEKYEIQKAVLIIRAAA